MNKSDLYELSIFEFRALNFRVHSINIKMDYNPPRLIGVDCSNQFSSLDSWWFMYN